MKSAKHPLGAAVRTPEKASDRAERGRPNPLVGLSALELPSIAHIGFGSHQGLPALLADLAQEASDSLLDLMQLAFRIARFLGLQRGAGGIHRLKGLMCFLEHVSSS